MAITSGRYLPGVPRLLRPRLPAFLPPAHEASQSTETLFKPDDRFKLRVLGLTFAQACADDEYGKQLPLALYYIHYRRPCTRDKRPSRIG